MHHGTVVERCVISGVTLDGQSVPADTVLHGLKLQDGRFVVRMYGVCDNPEGSGIIWKKDRRTVVDGGSLSDSKYDSGSSICDTACI